MKKQFVTFEEAKELALKLKLANREEWWEWSKSERPKNIPANPPRYYKNEGWKGWSHFLGREN